MNQPHTMLSNLSAQTKTTWNQLARYYEGKRQKKDSLDYLVEFPAQLKAIGTFKGKSILDLGCGSGEKSFYFATNGASEVLGVDICDEFINAWDTKHTPENLSFSTGDIADLDNVQDIRNKKFDIVTILQCLQFSHNLESTISEVRKRLNPDGVFVLAVTHPFRFAADRAQEHNIQLATSYRDKGPYSYPSLWNDNITMRHYTYSFSDILMAFAKNELFIEGCWEPDLGEEERRKFPHKAQWMDKYFGIIVYRLRLRHRASSQGESGV